ncbi:hypothetical protein ABRZ04_10130 [Castellaniella ginsengisoli]|uniref:Uncharacterized protein n=1 Tax=Castellaniella ginsengisoli TaxID=546114 RepID=A0AB39CWS6_9BURK
MQTAHPESHRKPVSPDSPKKRRDEKKTVEEREEALDDALDDTFPASDPVSTTPQPPAKPGKR